MSEFMPYFDPILGRVRTKDAGTKEIVSGGGGSVVGSTDWGTITGSLADQLDLQTALDLKASLTLFTGGTTGQVLTKDTDTDYDFSWQTPPATVTNDSLQDQELTATYAYVGYENTSDSSWYIYRRTRATNVREYATGLSSYATNWGNRNALIYGQTNESFDQTDCLLVDVSCHVHCQKQAEDSQFYYQVYRHLYDEYAHLF